MTDAQVEEVKRHFGVAAESLRSDIRQIAEDHSGIQREIQGLRKEFRDEFKEMRALMRPSFSQFDQRIHTLSTDIFTLKARMDHLESLRAQLLTAPSASTPSNNNPTLLADLARPPDFGTS